MITITIGQALDRNTITDTAHHCLYLYRDSDTVFYVGRALSPLDRLLEHMGVRGLESKLGSTICENLPASLKWQLEMYTLADCVPFIEQHMASTLSFYTSNLDLADSYQTLADDAESAMIDHYKPCLNSMKGTRYSNPLPARYAASQKIANKGVVLA